MPAFGVFERVITVDGLGTVLGIGGTGDLRIQLDASREIKVYPRGSVAKAL